MLYVRQTGCDLQNDVDRAHLCLCPEIFSFKIWTDAIVQNTCIKSGNWGAHCYWPVVRCDGGVSLFVDGCDG